MRLIIMFVAIALAAGAFFITMHFTNSEPDKSLPVAQPKAIVEKVPTIDIYTAKQDIPIGAIIKQEMLDIQPWPEHLKLPDMVEAHLGQPSELVKMVARTPFQKGEPIILGKLANEKDPSFLAASLPKGMRVVTIGTDAISGVGGFIFPGDRVDVLITHDVVVTPADSNTNGAASDTAITNTGNAASRGFLKVSDANATTATTTGGVPKKEPVTEVLLSNVRVMAVNQKSTAHGGEAPMVPSNISLEVSASDAQRLRLTENSNGRLSLALRSLKDKDEKELAIPTVVNDLSRLQQPNANAEGPKITVVRGIKTEAVEISRP